MKPIDITKIDYSKFGTLYNLGENGMDTNNTNLSTGDGFFDCDTNRPLLDTLGSLGMTRGCGTPCHVSEMERHEHTQEALFCTDAPIVFCVASPALEQPIASKIIPVILNPGFVFVLDRKVWHSSAHGINADVYYHWMALVYKNEPTTWINIAGGGIDLE